MHQEARPELYVILNIYAGVPPEFDPLDIPEETITEVGNWLSGGGGLGHTEMFSLQNWIPGYVESSAEILHIFVLLKEFLTNKFPPWAAYNTLMVGRRIRMNKQSGVRPLGIRETWRW